MATRSIHPQTEDYWGNVNPIGLRSCYDEGKRVAETLMMDYHRQNDVDTRIVRIFNTYGERMLENDGRVVSNFIVQALRGEELTIYGDGIADTFVLLRQRSGRWSDQTDECRRLTIFIMPVNMGNPGEFTMNELANEVARRPAREITIKHMPLPADDPKQRKPNIERAKTLLGWEPKVPLAEGLKKTVAYFRDYRMRPRQYEWMHTGTATPWYVTS